MKSWASENHIRSDVERETDRFVDYWTAEGKSKKDWMATWRNWMRRADDGWGSKSRSVTHTSSAVARGADPLPPDGDDGEVIVLPSQVQHV